MKRLFVIALALAACSPPDKPILPETLGLAVAQGDTWKLCADDGMQDTTPNADCVLAPENDPMKGYRDRLQGDGWVLAETLATAERWTRDGAACGILTVTGAPERFAAKMRTLLRFEVTCG